MVYSFDRIRKADDKCYNIAVVYNNWKDKKYFLINEAMVSFLKWVLRNNLWPNDWQICKMFYDTLSKLDPNLLTDQKIISQLTKAEQDKLKKIIASAQPATPTPTSVQKAAPAQQTMPTPTSAKKAAPVKKATSARKNAAPHPRKFPLRRAARR